MKGWWAGALLTATGCAAVPEQGGGDSILHYVRSNQDGSEAENIVMFRPTPTDLSVYKWVQRCTTAAYVTAKLNPVRWDAVRLDAGKVGPAGEQLRFGRMELDPASEVLSLQLDGPDGPIRDSIPLRQRPWHLFDYDFASLNAALLERRPRSDFSFQLILVWPEASGRLFRDLGVMHARHRGREQRGKRQTIRFDLNLPDAPGKGGSLWIDDKEGFIVDATLGFPNHDNYRDFRLRLDSVEQGGEAAWQRLLKAHHADCPAED